jgi:hypothetical protein
MSTEPYWDRPTVERLLRAYSDGGRPGALAAFPDLRPAQVYCAIRRYADAPIGEARPLMPRSEIHARIAAMPLAAFLDRVHGLVTWSPLRHQNDERSR